jgi:hypothetical protein
MDIRAAELTADHVGRTVKIDPGDQTSLIGRLVSVRHKRVGKTAPSETETQLELEVPGDQRIRLGFNSIGVVEPCRPRTRAHGRTRPAQSVGRSTGSMQRVLWCGSGPPPRNVCQPNSRQR